MHDVQPATGLERTTTYGIRDSRLILIIGALGVASGVIRAYLLRWVSDDAFVTFRYVDNLLAGKGLVYNEGERVEGYTHFLWAMILTLFRAVGFDLPNASIFLGLLCNAATLTTFLFISYQLSKGRRAFLPFTVLALAANYEVAEWATGGLETSFLTLLLALAFAVYYFTSIRSSLKLLFSGLLLGLAAITRPDAVLFLILANAALILDSLTRAGRDGKQLAATAGPNNAFVTLVRKIVALNALPAAIILPYFAWKYSYYGDILPNTYYAKSGGAIYFRQGAIYVWMYLQAHPTTFLLLAALPAIWIGMKARKSQLPPQDEVGDGSYSLFAPTCMALSAVAIYVIGFVAKVGGDFMFARLLVPVIPFGYFLIESSLVLLLPARRVVVGSVLALLVLVVFGETSLRKRVLFPNPDSETTIATLPGDIVDERWVYTLPIYGTPESPKGTMEWYSETAKALRPFFAGLSTTVLVQGGQNMIGYYADFKTCIIDPGLTDTAIAKREIRERKRPGHEKFATLEYLTQRKVDLILDHDYQKRIPYVDYRSAYIVLPDSTGSGPTRCGFTLFRYNLDLIRTLKQRIGDNFIYVDFPHFLDTYINTAMPLKPRRAVASDYQDFKRYYFAANPDTLRENAILNYLSGRQPTAD